MGSLVFLVPGHIDTATGGYAYDRRIVAGLRDREWSIVVRELHESFPAPTPEALDDAARALAAVDDDGTVMIDGLACGAMPAEVEREAGRLRIVALVHHPLAAETGTDPATADRLAASERRALAAARLVVVTSRTTASGLADYGVSANRIAVVEPGTDPAPLASGSNIVSDDGSNDGGIHMLCVATVIARKGHATLVRALASLRAYKWRLSCVGSRDRDPATFERLRLQVREAGLEDRVTFVGEVDAEQLAAYYAGADLFVLPTEYEGYGMAVAEALARGLPVVSTATGAIADLVGEDAGVLVPPGDAVALRAALESLMTDRGRLIRLAEGARRIRERLPSWDAASATMAEALEQVAAHV